MNSWATVVKLGSEVHLYIQGVVGLEAPSPESVIAELSQMPGEVHCHIDSPGGSSSVLPLGRYLAERDSVCHVKLAGSAAADIMIYCKRRLIYPGGKIMLHSCVNAAMGGPETLLNAGIVAEGLNREMVGFFAHATGQPLDVVRGWFSETTDRWFTAQEALDAGLVHAIEEAPTLATLSATSEAQPGRPNMTEVEQDFMRFLDAFGDLRVTDRQRFLRNLEAWAVCVQEENFHAGEASGMDR
jgi:ATP-dependent protease ClpP protease subunit